MTDNPTSPSPVRRLTRSSDDRVLAGVCGGLARFTGIDPVVFRVVIAVAALLGGTGVLAYLVAWLVIPKDDAPSHAQSFVDTRGRNLPRWVLILLGVVVAVPVLSTFDGPWPFFRGGFGLIALLVFGVWLWVRHDDHHGDAPPTGPPAPMSAPASGPGPVATEVPPVAQGGRGRSGLARVTLSAVAIVIGVLVAAIFLGADLGREVIPAAVLVTIGAGLLVGSQWGRARLLIPLGVFVLAITTVASVVDVPIRGGVGERAWSPTAAELDSNYRLAAGHAVLDLRGLYLEAGEHRRITVTVAVGYLEVWLPDGVGYTVEMHVGAGRLDTQRGSDLAESIEHSSSSIRAAGSPSVSIDAKVGMGRLGFYL